MNEKQSINLVEVETRNPKRAMYRVDSNGNPIGFLEKETDSKSERYPWKAFLGIGRNNVFLGSCFPRHAGKAYWVEAQAKAADAVLAAHQGADVAWLEFEKSHDAREIIESWRNV